MRANISAWAIRQPIPPIVLFMLLMFIGLVSFFSMQITATPDIDIPLVSVTVTQSGAAPSEMETTIVRPIEDVMANIAGIKHVQSTITEGVSRITAEFRIGTNTDRAVNDTRDAVTKVRQVLPQTIDEPQIERLDPAGGDVVGYVVTSSRLNPAQLTDFVDNVVIRALVGISGVSTVDRQGGGDREITINLNPERLIALGLTAADVNTAIRAVNTNQPGGRAQIGTKEQSIRALGSVESIEQLRNLTIPLGRGRQAHLADLGTIEDGFGEIRKIARLNGEPAVLIDVTRATGSSEVTVEKKVRAKVRELEAANPGLNFSQTFSAADDARESYDASMEALLIGSILAVVVVFGFLLDLRATLIVAIAMPLSVYPTFFVMQALGYTLNFISLLALTLVVGILVDDAIVEIENIVRHIRMGKTPYRAALDASDEIGLAVVATTMTIVAVFLPVSFMDGIAGQYFRQFGVTVAVAVIFSLMVARLITPMMAAYLGRDHKHVEGKPGLIMRGYLSLLKLALNHRWKSILLASVFFVYSIVLATFLPGDFLPAENGVLSIMSVELPPGATIEESDRTLKEVSRIIQADPDVVRVAIRLGGGTNADTRLARAFVTLKHKSERVRRKQQIEKELSVKLAGVPGIRFSASGGNGQDLSVVLTSDNPTLLQATAEKVIAEMQTVPTLSNIKSSASLLRPELQIRPNYERAAALGVSVAELSNAARIATLGEINANLPKFNLPDRQIPIRVEIGGDAKHDLNQIRNMRVATAIGGTVPLEAVADIIISSGTSEVKRLDRSRQVSIGADLNGAPLGQAFAAVKALPTMSHLPEGVKIVGSGNTEAQQEVFSQFGLAIGSGILMVFAVLVLLFRSFLQPLTIMAALPLSLGGAVGFLLITGESMSLAVLIGILMLMGIVTKNAILFVDYAMLAMREYGFNRRDALIEAGAKRAQPIVMTTIAMVAGMAPIALRIGNGGDFQAPMAIAVIGGLVTSTLLSLVMVPVGFTIIDDIQNFLVRRLGRYIHKSEHDLGTLKPAE